MAASSPSYPVIRADGVVIPDCSKGIYVPPFPLTPAERRELVRGLAERGLASIDEFIAKERRGGYVEERMEALKVRIRRDLEEGRKARREALLEELGFVRERSGPGADDYERSLLDGAGQRRLLSEELRRELIASELVLHIEGRAEQRDLVERPSLRSRVMSLIKGIFLSVFGFIGRIVRWLRSLFGGRRGAEGPGEVAQKGSRKGATILPLPGLMSDLSSWERVLEDKIGKDESLRRAVDSRLSESYGYSSGVIALRRSFDPDWYKEKAVEVLRSELGSIAKRKEAELEARRRQALERKALEEDKARSARERALELEKELEREAKGILDRTERLAREEMRKEVEKALSSMGYIQRRSGGPEGQAGIAEYEVTEALVERFSELVFSDLMGTGLRHRERPGSHISDIGIYDRARLRTVHEEARLDLLQTLVNAMTNHPDDAELDRSDMVVYREVPVSELHAVIILDVSGSMEENRRLEAAKRAVLALCSAIRRENPRNKVDIVTVSTRAVVSTLKEVLGAEPHGFTNHSEAVNLARRLFEGSRSDRMMLFMVTDGLPEAYTDSQGRPTAGDLEGAMERTLDEVRMLRRLSNLSFNLFMLEPKDTTYLKAAQRISSEGGGTMLTADPQDLAIKLVMEYERGTRPLTGV